MSTQKKFVALARVSSREQEREGFSLDVQEDALRKYAASNNGKIIRLFRIAETASKKDERKTFKEMISFAKKNAKKVDALLFCKVDRAARNLFDYVELERLETEYDIPFISISQQTDNSPAGRMMRRTLANMASFFTEQMAVDISQGLKRRVEEGLFPGRAPYGFRHLRINGRGLVEKDDREADNVQRMFELYAYRNGTLDGIVEQFKKENRYYRDTNRQWSRATVHKMLTDRAYIGEIKYKENWFPGSHDVLIDRVTWDRVQTLLGKRQQVTRTLTYAGNLIVCGHCGHMITGECKIKKTKAGPKEYIYYRCTKYSREGHPRTRIRESVFDDQMIQFFDRLEIKNAEVRDWFRQVLGARAKSSQEQSKAKRSELQRQEKRIADQQDRLLNMRIAGEIDEDTFSKKNTELRDRLASVVLQSEALNRTRDENAELASKVFELSQTLKSQWLNADYSVKRQILDIVWLNCRLEGENLVPTIRKPFDVLAEGHLVQDSGRYWT